MSADNGNPNDKKDVDRFIKNAFPNSALDDAVFNDNEAAKELHKLRTEILKLRAELAQLKDKLDQSQKENVRLRRELAQLRAELSIAQGMAQAATYDVQGWMNRARSAEAELVIEKRELALAREKRIDAEENARILRAELDKRMDKAGDE